MKKMYEAICKDCDTRFEAYKTYEEFEEILLTEKCTECGGALRRSFNFGGYRMGTGATRRPT